MKDVRPTSSKVLQALFNILGPLNGKTFLDLFAGSGRVGLYAYEKGARPVVEVELLRKRATAIRQMFRGEDTDFIVLSMDIRRALGWLARREFYFDIVFADPPYEEGWPSKIIELMTEYERLLKDDGVLIIEHSVRECVEVPLHLFVLDDRRTYGDTVLTFLKKERKEDSR